MRPRGFLIKSFLLLVCAFFCSSVLAWKVNFIDNGYYLVFKNRIIQLHYNGTPKFLKVTRYDKSIVFLDYFSGTYGTSKAIDITRRVIYNTTTDKVLIDAPYSYSNQKIEDQPKWTYSKQKKTISIKDPETGLDKEISWK